MRHACCRLQEEKCPHEDFRQNGSCLQQQHDDQFTAKDSISAAGNDRDSVDEKTEAILQALPQGGAAHKAVSPLDMPTCCRR